MSIKHLIHFAFPTRNYIFDTRRCYSTTPPAKRNVDECYDPDEWIHKFLKPKEISAQVFRDTSTEKILGPGAGKECCYKNPEYFSYHQYTFYDFNFELDLKRAILEKQRDACRATLIKGTAPYCPLNPKLK